MNKKTKKMSDKEAYELVSAERKLTIFHEAGHAVIGHMHGHKINYIEVHSYYEEDGTKPRVEYSEISCSDSERAMVIMAGTIAEGLCDRSIERRNMGENSDGEKLKDLARFWKDDALYELRRKTMQLLSREDVARAINDLVDVLDIHQTYEEPLDGKTAHKIIRNALEDNSDRKAFLAEVTGQEVEE